jgi:hypothetical protein
MMALIRRASGSDADVGCRARLGFPLRGEKQGMDATRFARRDATFYLGEAAGSVPTNRDPDPLLVASLRHIAIQRKTPEITEPQDPNECVSPDFWLLKTEGFPKMAVDSSLQTLRIARRDATLYLGFIYYSLF